MKVKIKQRSVYHKIAEIEVEVPDLIDGTTEVHEWLMENEDKWNDDMQIALDNAEIEFGNGSGGEWTDVFDESEWRYECEELELGGHL
tara:strand:- start:318 stop:581 length:264 start_codon:yes stop_codon:yes gene_type:complete